MKRGGAFQEEDMETVRRLQDALAELTQYKFRYLDNHATLDRDLTDLRTDLVFNLCDEGFNNDPFKELHVPAMLDALGLRRAHFVGNSQGGQSSMVVAMQYPDRINKLVAGGSHIGTGGDRYLMANRPSEGSRATREAMTNPTTENIRRYLRVHIDNTALVTDELVDYIHRMHTWSPELDAARQQSVSVPHDYTPELEHITAPTMLIHGRYDRMVPFEVSISILNHVANSRLVLLNNCGHWPPFEHPAEYTTHVLNFLMSNW